MKHVKLFEQFIFEEADLPVNPHVKEVKSKIFSEYFKLQLMVDKAVNSVTQTLVNDSDFSLSKNELKNATKLIESSLNKVRYYNVQESESDPGYPSIFIRQLAILDKELRNPNKYLSKFQKMKGRAFEDWNEFIEFNKESTHNSIFNRSNAPKSRFGIAAGVGYRDSNDKKPAFYIVAPPKLIHDDINHDQLERGEETYHDYYDVFGNDTSSNIFKININSFEDLENAIKLTIGNSSFIKLVNTILEGTFDVWVLNEFQQWKNEAPYRAKEAKAKAGRDKQREKQQKFFNSANLKTRNFFNDGTVITDKRAYSVKDFENIAKMFNSNYKVKGETLSVVERGPKLKSKAGQEYGIGTIYFEYESGRWTGGYEDRNGTNVVDMNLEEFVYAIEHMGFRP